MSASIFDRYRRRVIHVTRSIMYRLFGYRYTSSSERIIDFCNSNVYLIKLVEVFIYVIMSINNRAHIVFSFSIE
jgi:hypothetical protein